jgi:hypothetical protein
MHNKNRHGTLMEVGSSSVRSDWAHQRLVMYGGASLVPSIP